MRRHDVNERVINDITGGGDRHRISLLGGFGSIPYCARPTRQTINNICCVITYTR